MTERRFNAVHPSPKALLLIRQQALGAPSPFVAVLAHGGMVRLEAGNEVSQVFELGLDRRETREQGNVRLWPKLWRRLRHPRMNDRQRLSDR